MLWAGTLVVAVGVRVVLLGPDQFADLFFDLVHLREAIQGMFGEDLSPVEKDFERSCFTRGDRHGPQLVVVIVQQILRQTGGSRQIPSGGAVLDAHHWFLSRPRLARPSVGHGSPPFVDLPLGWLEPMLIGSRSTRVSHGRLAGATASRATCRTPRASRGG